MSKTDVIRVAILALSAKSYGGDSYFQALLPALNRYGKNIECILLAYDDRYRPLCPDGGLVTLRTMAIRGLRTGFVRVLWEQIALPRVLSTLDVDVVYTANNLGILRSPKPCVIAIRNMEPLVQPSPGSLPTLRVRHKLLNWLTQSSIRRASRIVAVSNFVRDTLMAGGVPSEKIDVIYHGIDDLAFPFQQVSGGRTLQHGYVASAAKFIQYANLATLFRAFARMRSLGYKGELRFAGGSYDPRYEKKIKALIRELGVEAHVRFLGYISRSDVQAMMRECDAFLFSSMLEACPFTLLEAMRQGAPIVTTTSRPMPEFCGDAAIYVEPTDSDAFGEAAYRVVGNPELQVSLHRKARIRAESFKWKDSVSRLIATWKRAACAC